MQTTTSPAPRWPGFGETVALIAALMGMTALAIDTMLPALPNIGGSFGIAEQNNLQFVVYVYMGGFALAQVIYGPLADIFGRRPVLLTGLVILALGAVLASLAPSFELLLAARLLQGVGAAAPRVLAVSIVRDRFAGREMARVMSFIMMIFIIIPVLAPSLGGFILLVANWRLIFTMMAVLSIVTTLWYAARMPETLHPEYRRRFSLHDILGAGKLCVTNRMAFGYATALCLMFGTLMAYIGSAEQILGSDGYRLGTYFPLAFASVALFAGFSNYLNSRLVQRFGMRRLSHSSLIAYVIVTGLLLAVTLLSGGIPPLLLFMVLLGLSHFCFANITSNFNALALEPLGAVAGTASSLIGSYTTLVGAFLGALVGQAFDGTVIPYALGCFGLSAIALGVVLWTEKGKLFQQHHHAPAATVKP
ncbi:multidrug effflux MFS transporter [Oryzibacter oryziterrae]|uniref:multidrug effflux MFS transporter n=1 Tax=Oryzibacter oryziterrae TaxID=2766474 RepID=UPI001F1EFB2F|nr:multidrug effflux MFS transporter [Oryzibacter oryziterrae]